MKKIKSVKLAKEYCTECQKIDSGTHLTKLGNSSWWGVRDAGGTVFRENAIIINKTGLFEIEYEEEHWQYWKPEKDETFYFIDMDGDIDRFNEMSFYESAISLGNCFKTEADAKDFRDKYYIPALRKFHEEKRK